MTTTLSNPTQNKYDAKDITVLEGLEAVRKRPGMYIGSSGEDGLKHLVYEIVDNGVDEAMAGYADTIRVKINADGSVKVSDNGRGIPVDTHAKTGKSAVETVMTTLHAGGKFGGKSYQVSGGLHGVGASVVNALSEKLWVEVWRNGQSYTMEFAKGKPVSALKATSLPEESKNLTGTTVTWSPDVGIFKEINYNIDVLMQRFKEMAYLNPGLRIVFVSDFHQNLWPNNRVTYYFDGGAQAFVRNINRRRGPLTGEIFYASDKMDEILIDVAIQYNASFAENCLSFVNCIRTNDGGTHVTGFRAALTRVINDFARKHGTLKNEVASLSGEDVREGLVAVVSVKVPEPQFEGQTKGRLGNPEVKGAVEQMVGRKLSEFLEDNPTATALILNKSLTAARARAAAKKARDLVIRKNAMDGGALPGKLADCSEKDPAKSEIFIVEGESAGGSAKQGRDRHFQAILPLKGKILNVEKARLEKMLAHDEIIALITAVGTGIGEDWDASKLRYHKVIVMTDADVDGAHIRTLLLTFFFRHMNDLISNGYLYIAQPPLYRISKGRSSQWLYSEQQLDAGLAQRVYTDVEVLNQDSGAVLAAGADLGDTLTKLRQTIELFAKLQSLGMDKNDIRERIAAEQVQFDDTTPPELHEMRALLVHTGKFVDAAKIAIRKTDKIVADGIAWTDLPEQLGKLADRSGINIQRYKGLGEMNPDQLWDTTMNPATRRLYRVTASDASAADEIFSTLMGDEVEPRRNFIRANALAARNLDI